MTERTDLVTRLEAAETGSRELDAYIWAETNDRNVRENENNLVLAKSRNPPYDECLIGIIDPGEHTNNFRAAGSTPPIPWYTTSLDAALTLVPEGWSGHLAFETPSPGSDTVASARLFYTAEDPRHYGVAATPALALAIAAMKALQP